MSVMNVVYSNQVNSVEEKDIISITGKKWKKRFYCERTASMIAQKMNIEDVVAKLIASRDILLDDVEIFLNPRLKYSMPDPYILNDMEKAANYIIDAIQKNKKIAVFGDYDVDGGTSSAILYRFFKMLDKQILVHIPDRMKEGYGPNIAAFEALKEKGADIIITVDCGSTAFDVMSHAKKIGLDVIILDHHQTHDILPDVVALVNPNRFDDMSDLGYLTAAGVCFMFISAVHRLLRQNNFFTTPDDIPNILNLLDLVALGTVCDVAPLVGLNRAFVSQGLRVLKQRQNLGLAAIADIAQITEIPSTYHCGFIFGPRINAGGRIGRASAGFELLTTNCSQTAHKLAQELNDSNQERQTLEMLALEEAISMVESEAMANHHVIIVASTTWHAGIIGIVAARLKEKYQRPCFVLAIEGDVAKGSGRSLSGVDLGEAVKKSLEAGLLVNGGGHKMAAGLTLETHKINDFRDYINKLVEKDVDESLKNNALLIDGIISVGGATFKLWQSLEQIAPYGIGNPTPLLMLSKTRISFSKIVGENHVSATLTDSSGFKLKAIAFRSMDNEIGAALLNKTHHLNILGTLKRDTWQGDKGVQFIIDDVSIAN